MTPSEAREAMLAGVPVLRIPLNAETEKPIEYERITGIFIRPEGFTYKMGRLVIPHNCKNVTISVELLDYNGHSATIASLERVRLKEGQKT